MEQNKFLVIDGNSIMNRAFYAIKLLTTKDGLYTNAIYGFLNIYYMMLDKLNPNYVAVSFDLSAPTFRHKMYNKYKAQRKSMPDELRLQMPIMKDILRAMNIPIIELEGYEADDVLGTIAKENTKNNIFTYILTGDKDSFQIISDNTSVVIPISKFGKTEYSIFTPEALKEKYGIEPYQVIETKAFMGDASDNIPGVPGIGEKTAYTLIEKYQSLKNIYDNIDSLDVSAGVLSRLVENKEMAILSHALATINTEVPMDLDYEALKFSDVNIQELSKLFTRLQFKKFLDKYSEAEGFEDTTNTNILQHFDEKSFQEIESAKKLEGILKGDVCFIHFESKDKDKEVLEKFKNNIYILANNSVYYFNRKNKANENNRMNKENSYNNSLLQAFANADCTKVGYRTKKTIKAVIDSGMRNIIGFKSDIEIAYYLLHPEESNYSIENIAYNMLGLNFPPLETKKVIVQTSIFDTAEDKVDVIDNELTSEEKKYIYSYLIAVKQINKMLVKELKEKDLYELYTTIEIPLIQTLADMESVGMYIDKVKLREFGNYLDKNLALLKEKITSLSGEDFNINSPQQLGIILFEKLKLPYYKKNATSYTTDKEVLENLLDIHPVIKEIMDFRSLSKLRSTYVEGLMGLIDETGRLHTTFMQTVTATGRLSSTEPNLQNIPVRTELGGKIRECFVADKGTEIIDADYSQIELRILAHMAKDDIMLDAFRNGEDIHTSTAAKVFDIPIEDVTKDQRSKAKAVNFGIVYGISDYGLAKNISVSREEAKKYIEAYLSKYSEIDQYMKRTIKECEEKGYISTIFGRRRNVPELKSGNHNTVMFGKRVAMNMPIQGSAADIMKKAMNDVYYTMLEKNLKSRVIMQVHDELIVEATEDELEEVKTIVKECMQNVIKLDVPLLVDINVAQNWYAAK